MLPVFFISLMIFIFLSVPIAFSLGLSTVLGVWLHETLSMEIIPQRIFVSLNSFPLMAIPFFILAGNLMGAGGISKRLVNFASSLVGHFTGGLAMVAIVTSMFFCIYIRIWSRDNGCYRFNFNTCHGCKRISY